MTYLARLVSPFRSASCRLQRPCSLCTLFCSAQNWGPQGILGERQRAIRAPKVRVRTILPKSNHCRDLHASSSVWGHSTNSGASSQLLNIPQRALSACRNFCRLRVHLSRQRVTSQNSALFILVRELNGSSMGKGHTENIDNSLVTRLEKNEQVFDKHPQSSRRQLVIQIVEIELSEEKMLEETSCLMIYHVPCTPPTYQSSYEPPSSLSTGPSPLSSSATFCP